jgi:hypothetical protein
MRAKKERVDRLVTMLVEDDGMMKRFEKRKRVPGANRTPPKMKLEKTIDSMNPMVKDIESIFLPKQK